MLRELNNRGLAYGVPGLAIQTVGSFAHLPLLTVIGSVLLVIGLAYYSKAKGHSGFWGLFGLLSLLGIIVLVVLKDRTLTAEVVQEARRRRVKRFIMWPILILGLIIAVPVVIFLAVALLGIGK